MFRLLVESIELIRKHTDGKVNNIYPNLLKTEVDIMEDNYRISTIHILNDYYRLKESNAEREEEYTKQYYQVITSENFSSSVMDFAVKLRRICDGIQEKNADIPLDYVYNKLDKCQGIDISVNISKTNYEICMCGMKMQINSRASQLYCEECGYTKTLYGTVFEDNQFYNQEGQKTKHGSYDPNRHFKFWMDRIQAKENKVFPPEHIDKIEAIIKRDGYVKGDISCDLMRKFLKETQLTKYNDHVPLLLKQITGVIPPQLTFNENRVFSIKFNKIMTIYHSMTATSEEKKGNRPYYPYFIRKIAEQEFAADNNKLKILEYIHLQSGDTVTRHDKIYEKICELADPEDGLVYKPTDYSDRRP